MINICQNNHYRIVFDGDKADCPMCHIINSKIPSTDIICFKNHIPISYRGDILNTCPFCYVISTLMTLKDTIYRES